MSVFIPRKNGHGVFIGIYRITSPSGKVYIGQSWDIEERWRSYKSSYPLRGQPKLASSLRKYGAANHKFEIVAWFSAGCSQPILDGHEQLWMDRTRAEGNDLLNLREAGSKGRQSPESSAKMVATRRANGSYVVSDDLRKRWSEQRKGHPGVKHTEETKRKLAEIAKNRPPRSAETKEKLARVWRGRKHSAETKAKIGNANRGNKRPDLAEYNRTYKSRKPAI